MDTSTDMSSHEKWMSEAISLAEAALREGEFPVGAVLVADNQIIGRGARLHSKGVANELDHAEIIAIRDMTKGEYFRITPFDVRDITAYVTLEPCLMCLGALLINGVRQIVFAYEDVMGGACGLKGRLNGASWVHQDLMQQGSLTEALGLYNRWNAIGGVMRKESLGLFKSFFRSPHSGYLKDTLLARYTLEVC